MTRSIVIVSLWLLLVDGIVDSVYAASGSPLRLLALYYAISAATVLALWLQFRHEKPDAPVDRRGWDGCRDP